jgi:uncharacterized protein YegJ (DUF2314 family)
MLRRLLLCLALYLVPLELAAQGDPTVDIAQDDPEMVAAVSAALASLPLFMAHAMVGGDWHPDAYLKVAIPVDGGTVATENIWVWGVRDSGGGQYVGKLANEPNLMPGLHVDSKVSFSEDMIRDWSFYIGDLAYGSYTTRVVAARLPKAEARELLATLPDTPIPADW